MTHIVSFRPGVAKKSTAFESMAKIYKYLQDNHNYEFTIVTSVSDDYTDSDLNIISIQDGDINSRLAKISQFTHKLPASWLVSSELDSYFNRADAILTLDPTTFVQGEIGVRKAISTETPIWFDSGRTTRRPWLGFIWKIRRRILRQYIEQVSGIIATSPKVLERFREIRVFNEKIASKFSIIGHPVDVDKFSSDGNETEGIDILTVGRLVPEKGYYYILEALEPLLRQHKEVSWKVVGDGPLSKLLKKEIKIRGISDSVDLCGVIPHSQMANMFTSSDIFISHSIDIAYWEEFFGASNIEAMSCELPCVLTNSGSIPYVMRDKEICDIVPQRNIVSLRSTVNELIESPGKRRNIGRKARQFVVKEYSVAAIGEKFNKMIKNDVGT